MSLDIVNANISLGVCQKKETRKLTMRELNATGQVSAVNVAEPGRYSWSIRHTPARKPGVKILAPLLRGLTRFNQLRRLNQN